MDGNDQGAKRSLLKRTEVVVHGPDTIRAGDQDQVRRPDVTPVDRTTPN